MAKQSKHRLLTVQAPLGGTHRRSTYQQQPPFTAWTTLNVWPQEPLTGRRRLSTRAGLAKTDATRPGTSSVRLLHPLNVSAESGHKQLLVASSGGALYTWDGSGSWTSVTTSLTLASDRPIQAAPFGNKLYIADWGIVDSGSKGVIGDVEESGTDGVITDATPDTFDSASVADWTTNCDADMLLLIYNGDQSDAHQIDVVNAGDLEIEGTTGDDDTGLTFKVVDPGVLAGSITFTAHDLTTLTGAADDYVLLITAGDNQGVWDIDSISGTVLTISRADGGAHVTTPSKNQNLKWAVVRSSKVYDYDAGTLTKWSATSGVVPHGCKCIAVWQDRMSMANDGVDGHVWYMSRSGDPDDWLYGEETQGSPVSGNNFRGGSIGRAITCLISLNLECIIIGCLDSLWVMRGDPLQGGYLERLSHNVGPIGPFAWCHTPDENVVMLTRDGFYIMPAVCGDTPRRFSREILPTTFLEWDDAEKIVTGASVHMEFCTRFNGILVARDTGLTHSYYWIDWANDFKGFWRFDIASSEGIYLSHYESTADARSSSVMIGCEDGYIRNMDADEYNDDSSEFDSYVEIGPIKISSSPFEQSGVVAMTGKMGADSDPVIPTIRVGRDAESVAQSISGEFQEFALTSWDSDSDKYHHHPHIGGHALILRLEKKNATATAPWTFEEAHFRIRPLGVQR